MTAIEFEIMIKEFAMKKVEHFQSDQVKMVHFLSGFTPQNIIENICYKITMEKLVEQYGLDVLKNVIDDLSKYSGDEIIRAYQLLIKKAFVDGKISTDILKQLQKIKNWLKKGREDWWNA